MTIKYSDEARRALESRGTAPDRRWLTPGGLAERYGVPVSTVYGWNLKRTGPRPYRFGRHVRYRESEVLAWEQECAVGSPGDAA